MSRARRHGKIAAEARFDGIYVIRTSLEEIEPDAAVAACKSLSTVERAFRTARSRLRVRPVCVCTEDQVRGHVFLCTLSHYVEWQMRRRLAPLLFEDDDRAAARTPRTTPVEKARVSPGAKRKPTRNARPRESPGAPVPGYISTRYSWRRPTTNPPRKGGPR